MSAPAMPCSHKCRVEGRKPSQTVIVGYWALLLVARSDDALFEVIVVWKKLIKAEFLLRS